MVYLITGGNGFLGRKLAKELLGNSESTSIIILDISSQPIEERGIKQVKGDINDLALLRNVVTPEVLCIFHLAAVLSGGAEANYDLAFEVNVRGTNSLLQACRTAGHCPTFVFASSVAVFGRAASKASGSEDFTETSLPTPQSSYGTQKAMCEMMVADASRKGIVRGVSVRLPTVAVRPGSPNSATSSFVSSIVREPLGGKQANCPVSPATSLWIQSPRVVVQNLIRARDVASNSDFEGPRTLTMPGLTTTPAEMLRALEDVGGDSSLVSWKPEQAVSEVVGSWPGSIQTPLSLTLGFSADKSAAEVVQAFMEDDLATVHLDALA